MISKEELSGFVQKIFPEIKGLRDKIHANPELSFQEFQTSELVCSVLDGLQVSYRKGIAGTGLLGWIEGKDPGSRTIALRADMDALPIQEKTGLPFASTNEGVMHACGHDVHTSVLLGTAKVLKHFSDRFKGTVLLVFQPGEELLPGGAKIMLEDGLFSEKKPDLIIGQHVQPGLPAGSFGFREGLYMASGDEIYLTLKGKGGHAATPHLITNTILAASHVLLSLQQIPGELAPKDIPTVLSFGKVIANGATNIVPDEVHIEGTFRTMNEEWRTKAHEKITEIASLAASEYRAECLVRIEKGYPVLVNHVEYTRMAVGFAEELAGKRMVLPMDLRMGTEDFAWFTRQYPCVFYRLGTGKENGLHTATFEVDESILASGTEMMAWLALSFLKNDLKLT
jgi:amidohydrolase